MYSFIAFGESIGLLAEILLIHYSILVNDEGHHAGRPVFRRIGHESETLGHFAVYDVTFRAAWAIFPLTRQDVVIVTAVMESERRLGFCPLAKADATSGPMGLWGSPSAAFQ